jgi:hypothetical protein
MSRKFYLTAAEFCTYWDMKQQTVKDACRTGRIISCRKNSKGHWEIHRERGLQEFNENKKINQHQKKANLMLQQKEQNNFDKSSGTQKNKVADSDHAEGEPQEYIVVDGVKIPSAETSKRISEHFKAQKHRAEYEEKIKNLVDLRLVRKEWRDKSKSFRNFIMKISDRVAPIVASETDAREVRNILDRELRESLEILAKGDEVD